MGEDDKKISPPRLGDPVADENRKKSPPIRYPNSIIRPTEETQDTGSDPNLPKIGSKPSKPPQLDKTPGEQEDIPQGAVTKFDPPTPSSRITDTQVKQVRQSLKKVKRTPKKSGQKSELTEKIESRRRNEKIGETPYLMCQKCMKTEPLSTHCFMYMKVEEDQSSCRNCGYSQETLKHCGITMILKSDEMDIRILDVATNLIDHEKYEQAKIHLQNFLEVPEIKVEKYSNALGLLLLSHCQIKLRRNREALYSFKEAQELITQHHLDNLDDLMYYYNGLYHLEIGDYITASSLLDAAIELFSEENMRFRAILHKGNIARLQGFLEKADTMINDALEFFKSSGDTIWYTKSLIYRGLTQRDFQDYDSAIQTFFEVQGIAETIDKDEYITHAGSILVAIGLMTSDDKLVADQLMKIERLAKMYPENPEYQLRYQLSRALVNKSSNRMVHKAKALETLEDLLIKQYYSNFEDEAYILVNICDLLIQEFSAFEEDEVFQELRKYIDRLTSKSKDHSHAIYLTSLLLKTKLELIDSNFELAQRSLQKASIVAKEHELHTDYDKILRMQSDLREQHNKWLKLNQAPGSVKQRLDKSEISIYIKQAMKLLSKD